ncbi:histidinol phosphatase [Flavobacterium sp. 316]|uniref:tyrosine-protein phosphatase n=1 Tax=Flavobacterium sp. 316 TaxID=1603293 RepID=UPI0005E1E8CC|nr:CpsB/CapC family capsule biosynthesis tyrosine phosphatase [Flavobacterium sp. 316]KIX19799.1 histidinol phosphatase [Flavobacterium sp. 316]
MFPFFKSKPKLSELIPNDYVDIHSHILPSIDDGAKTMDDSRFLMNEMINLGFKKVIATPHTIKNVWNNSKETIIETKEKVEKELTFESSRLQLDCASEYYMDENFVIQFESEDLLTLKDNYVLVEMSYLNAPIQLYDILFELQLKGYKPVLAHPERYTFFHSKFSTYEELKKAGCLFQMNLLSSVGYYGKDVTMIAEKLLNHNLIDFVGSDIHHKNHIEFFKNKILIKSLDKFELAISKNVFFS